MTSRRILFAVAFAASLSGAGVQTALAQDAPPRQSWSFSGPFGLYDQAQLQRGYKFKDRLLRPANYPPQTPQLLPDSAAIPSGRKSRAESTIVCLLAATDLAPLFPDEPE